MHFICLKGKETEIRRGREIGRQADISSFPWFVPHTPETARNGLGQRLELETRSRIAVWVAGNQAQEPLCCLPGCLLSGCGKQEWHWDMHIRTPGQLYRHPRQCLSHCAKCPPQDRFGAAETNGCFIISLFYQEPTYYLLKLMSFGENI